MGIWTRRDKRKKTARSANGADLPAVSASEHDDFPVLTTARHTWEIIGDGEREARRTSVTRNPSLLHCRTGRNDNW